MAYDGAIYQPKRTVEWLSIGANGHERPTRILRRGELYERQQRIRASHRIQWRTYQTTRQRNPVNDLALTLALLASMSTVLHFLAAQQNLIGAAR
jgi:hypothetical protein